MCERVLERVLDLRKETCLIEKLRGLKPSEATAKFLLRLIRDGLEQHQRNILANNSRRLKKTFFLRRKSIDSSGQHSLHCCRHLRALNRFRQPIIPSLTRQKFGFYQRPDALLQEEWIPFGSRDQELFQRLQTWFVPQQRFESSSALSGGSGSIRSWL